MARTVVFGKSGSGKSWFTGQRIEQILEPDDPDDEFEYAIHVDLEDEEKGLSVTDDPLLATFECDEELLRDQVVVDPDDPPEYIPEEELADGPVIWLPKWVVYRNKYVRTVPEGLTADEQVVLTEMMADAALMTGDCHFSMDEAHRIATTSMIRDRLETVITGGRKRGVEWAFITQRPQAIHKQIISQVDIGIFMKLTSERDLKKADALAETFDAEETLQQLPTRVAIVENYEDGSARRIDTEDLERKRPHLAGDDGKANDKWLEGGEVINAEDIEDEVVVEDADDGDDE
jgi:hypothetical protein